MPSPYKKSFAAEQRKLRPKKKPGLWIFLAVVGIVVFIGGYALYSYFSVKEEPAPQEAEIKSIAVLAFDDMSPNKDQEWFCDGIAEAIINALTHVEGLHVCARNSAFSFKGQHPDVREVGKKLNVEAVLEGSVVKSDSKLRITTQLVNVADGFHIWSETYDRDTEEVFDLLEEISLAVVEELKVKLLDKEKAAIAKRPTENLEAYELYLLGQHYWWEYTWESLQKSLLYYMQAIDKDPDFALAYAGIADVFIRPGIYSSPYYPIAKAAAEKALEIDSTLAEAYVSLAWYNLYYKWDFSASERAFKRAFELNPGYYLAHQWYTDYLLVMRRFNEALVEIRKAQELNPQYIWTTRLLMEVLMVLGRYDEATEQYHKLKEINQISAYWCLGKLYTYQSNYKDAIETIQKVSEEHPYLGYIYAISGERYKAEQILHEHIELRKEQYASYDLEEEINGLRLRQLEDYLPSIDTDQIIRALEEQLTEQNFISTFSAARIYAGLGEYDKAFEILETTYKMRSTGLLQTTIYREFEPLRSDQRYKDLMKRIGLE